MADKNNMDPAVDLRLLQEIRAEYETRAITERITLPAFGAQGRTGHDLLLTYRDYLKTLPPLFLDKFGCEPHCADGSCQPCDDWERLQYERFRLYLRLSNDVDMPLLQEIQAEYRRLAIIRQVGNPGFTFLEFDPQQFEDIYPNVKFFRYLKTLAFHFSDKVGCDPHCPDGSCPPCDGWGRAQYAAFLQKLRTL